MQKTFCNTHYREKGNHKRLSIRRQLKTIGLWGPRFCTGLFISFQYTWNELFLVNWFISTFFGENTKWHGLSYSFKRDSRSISKITFYANWRVSPTDTEIWEFFKQKLLFVIFTKKSWSEPVHHKQFISSVWKLMNNPLLLNFVYLKTGNSNPFLS